VHIVITACSSRKSCRAELGTAGRNLPFGSLSEVKDDWDRRIASAPLISTAQVLYRGRAFGLAVSAASSISAELYIVSAGLGFVSANQTVPAYNLTVSKGSEDCVLDRITPGVSEADWWRTLISPEHVQSTLRSADGLIFIGLGAAYLQMLEPLLLDLPSETIERLRIFTGAPNTAIPRRLLAQTLPYDARLDAAQGAIRGTKIDFASRALHHFVTTIMIDLPDGGVSEQARLVESILKLSDRPMSPRGARRSDADIKTLLRQHWGRAGGSTTKLLRVLRDELAIACEQKRLVRLAGEVRCEAVLP